MDTEQYLAVLEDATERLAAAAGHGLGAQVPPCPDWTVGDLVHHVGAVHRWWSAMLETRPEPAPFEIADRPPDGELVEWLRSGAADLRDSLSKIDPAEPCWTW